MKTPARMLLLATTLLLAGPPPAQGEARSANHPRFSGRAYVRLGLWARANEFTVRGFERDKTLQLSNRWARLVFNLDPRQDSRRAQINGVEVWLSFPIVYQNGSAFISSLDLEQTLGPILSPPANAPGIRVRTICLDAGHGGKDPGYRVGANEEKKFTLLLAREIGRLLVDAGFEVILTRDTDVFVELPVRTAIARKHRADLFVSLHFNAFDGPRNEAQGCETYCLTPAGATSTNARGEGDSRWVAGNGCNEKSTLLAYHLQKSLVKSLPTQDRGVKRARYRVLSDATMPAILIEGGFLSHPLEGQRILDPNYRRQMARAIVDGIRAYQRTVKG